MPVRYPQIGEIMLITIHVVAYDCRRAALPFC